MKYQEITIKIREDQLEALKYAAENNGVPLWHLLEGMIDHLQVLATLDYLEDYPLGWEDEQ